MHTSDLLLPVYGMSQVSNAAGHSHGGSSPSRTHAYVHADSACTWSHVRGVLHLIDNRGLISIPQEHDISARVLGLGTVTRDHEPGNALT